MIDSNKIGTYNIYYNNAGIIFLFYLKYLNVSDFIFINLTGSMDTL